MINGKEFIAIVDSKAYKINLNDCSLIQELQSDHQEGDTRLLLHGKHASEDHDKVVIVSPDTDVFLIALSKSPLIQSHLYMLTGTGKHTRIIDFEAVAVSAMKNSIRPNVMKRTFLMLCLLTTALLDVTLTVPLQAEERLIH